MDSRGRYTYCSPQMKTLWEIEPESMIGRTPFELTPEKDREQVKQIFFLMAESQQPFSGLVTSAIVPRGTIWIETSGVPFFDGTGRLLGYRGISRDITERVRADEDNAQLRTLMDHNPSLIFLKDEEGRYVYLNETYERLFVNRKDWKGKTDFDFWPEESAALFSKNDRAVLATGMASQFMEDSTNSTGTRYVWLNYKFPFIDARGCRYVGGIGIDVTERVEIEEALAESEEKYRTVTENIQGVIQRFDQDLRILYLSPQVEQATGIPPEQFLGRTNEEMGMPPGLCSLWNNLFADVRSSGEPRNLVFDFPGPGGPRTYLLKVVPEFAPDGSIGSFLGISTDVTEQRKIEAALKESEERLRLAQGAARIGSWKWDVSTGHLEWSPELADPYGYEPEEFTGEYDTFSSRVHPDDLRMVEEVRDTAVREHRLFEYDFRILLPSGDIRWMYSKGAAHYDTDGNTRQIFGINMDITERKRAEAALRASEREERERATELDAILATTPSPIFIVHDATGHHITGNPAADRLLRIPYGGEMSLTAPEDHRPHNYKCFREGRELTGDDLPAQRAALGLPLDDYEFDIVFDDGVVRHVIGNARPLLDERGRPRGAILAVMDITARRQAETALREAQTRTASVIDSIADTFYSLDEDWRFTSVNPAAEKAPFGRPAAELIGNVIWDLFPSLVGTPIHRHYLDAAEKKSLEHYEAQSPLNSRGYEVFMKGRTEGIDVYMRDITDQKEAEAERSRMLKEEQARAEELQKILDAVPAAVWIGHDPQARHITGNRLSYEWLNLSFGAEASKSAPAGERPTTFRMFRNGSEVPVEEMPVQRAARGEHVRDFEFTLVYPDDTKRHIVGNAETLRDEQGMPRGSVASFMDITARKKAEEDLRHRQAEIQALFDNIPAGLVLFDAQPPYRVLVHNRYYQELFAEPYRSSGMAGLSIDQFAPDAGITGLNEVIGNVVRTRQKKNILDFPYNPNPWKKTWFNWYLSPIIIDGRVVSLVSMSLDVTDRHRAEEAVQKGIQKLDILAESARHLLSGESPALIVRGICERLMQHLSCNLFFHYMIIDNEDRMKLYTSGGVSEETIRSMEYMPFGTAVCGCVGRDGAAIIAENIRNTPDPRTDLVRSFGIQAYACFPLIYHGKTIGTLSFGTASRRRFLPEEIELMQAVSDLVAIAMARIKSRDALRASEDRLLRAQELLDTVTKSSGVMIAAEDTDLRYTYFNKAYADEIHKITGKELALGMTMGDLFAGKPEERENSLRQWQKILGGSVVRDTVSFDTPDGTKMTFNVIHAPIRDKSGTIIGAGEVSYDVTRLVRAEEELRKASDYLESLINSASAPIIVWDAGFRITRFNQAFERLTGLNAPDMIGRRFEILIPKKQRKEAMDLIRRTSAGDHWDAVEIPIQHMNGETRIVLWNSATLYEEDGTTMIATIAQGQDITERKWAEARALDEKNRVEEAFSLLHAAIESAGDGIYVVDLAQRITGYNQNFARLWNLPPDLLKEGDDAAITASLEGKVKAPEDFRKAIGNLALHPERESFDIIELRDGRIFERQ